MLMKREVTVPATQEPISLMRAKEQLRVTDTNSDSEITELIADARSLVEEYTSRYWAPCTVRLQYDGFPGDSLPLFLPVTDVASIVSISYLDEDDATQTITSGTTLDGPRQQIRYNDVWPYAKYPLVTVTISPSVVPRGIRRAILLVLTDIWERRSINLPYQVYDNPAACMAMDPYRLELGV